MEIALTGLAFLVSALCAGVMGFAIQRGATCTVVAVDEVVSKHTFRRLTAMVEASVWVAGGLFIAQSLHLLGRMPSGYPLSGWTALGGALLGLGAYVNRACVFGAIARLGTGEWAYLATPVGFYVGCLSFWHVFALPAPRPLTYGSPVLQAPAWVAALFVAFMAWRIARPAFATRSHAAATGMLGHWYKELAAAVWSPHAATTVIAVAFLSLLLLVGAWSYTDVLAELARGMAGSLLARTLLLLALLLGAMLGGWTAGRFGSTRMTPVQVLRCFAGGVIMAWGGLLIPGGNDGLILVGMPLLWPYAWVAFTAMCVSIGAVRLAQVGLSRPTPSGAAPGGPRDAAGMAARPPYPLPR
jgi:Sulphur transport